MKPLIRLLFAVLTAFASAMPSPTFAAATVGPLNFCNRTSAKVAVAAGYYSQGVRDTRNMLTGPFVSRGWWFVEAGQCQSFANPFDARYMFWFPVRPENPTSVPPDSNADFSPIDTTNTAVHMCITSHSFTFEDENVSFYACHKDRAVHTRWVVPHKVDTAVDPTVNFTGYDY